MAREKIRSNPPARRKRANLFELAYQCIEDLLVNCILKPGRFLTVRELQCLTGFGRTPAHAAVNRHAEDHPPAPCPADRAN